MNNSARHRDEATAWYHRYRSKRRTLAYGVAAISIIFGAIVWFKNNVLVIDPGKGAPIGLCVRTDAHVASLMQTLEPYTPSLDRDHGRDQYAISMFIVPLDGSDPRTVPIMGDLAPSEFALAKILGSDGRSLWYDVNGIGAIDLSSFEARAKNVPVPTRLQGALTSPFAPGPDDFLSAGLITGPGSWLGLHSIEELERDFKPKQFVRRVVRQEDAKRMRRFFRGTLEKPVDDKYHRILSMEPLSDGEFLNAAFVRMDDRAEPLRLRDPDGLLMIHTSVPGLKGTLVVSRVDLDGRVLWSVDTALDRFNLAQILPGERSTAFIGTRLPVPGKVSEPLLVIVEHTTGRTATHSLWR